MKAPSDDTSTVPRVGAWRRWVPLAVMVAVVVVVFATGLDRYITLGALAENYAALRQLVADQWLLAALGFAAVYVVSTALSLPFGAVLTIGGGLLFGWWRNTLIVVVAATIGASILFWVARSSIGKLLSDRAGPRLHKLQEGFQQDAASYLLFLRLVPAFPFALVNFAPGVIGVGFFTYFWTTLIGIAPGTAAFSFAGEGLASVIEAQSAARDRCLAAAGTDCGFALDPGSLVTPQVLVAFAALGVLALIPPLVKRLRRSTAG